MNYYDKGITGEKRSMEQYMAGYPKYPYRKAGQKIGPTQSHLNLFPVDEGFAKGTIFRNLYRPYKKYQPRPVMPTTERERLLYDVDKYYFALHEIRLYLDVYPNDEEAIKVFSEFQEQYIRAKHAYETRFGALDIEAPNLDTSPWNWTVGRWPWEGGK